MTSTQAKERPSSCQRRRIRPRCYTIDALTDGSEWTGEGTLFLSVYKEPPFANESLSETDSPADNSIVEDNRSFQAPPLARYAFGSLSDLTSRLAFDQRFSLASTKAFFQLTSHENGPRCQGLEGLPALLLNLQQAGAEKLTLVLDSNDGPADNNSTLQAVQDTIELILPSHRSQHPRIQLCSVPRSQSRKSDQSSWWMVYRDDYILVHAKRPPCKATLEADSSTPQSTVDSVVYLVTLLCHDVSCASLIVVSGSLDPTNQDGVLRLLPFVGGTDDGAPDETAKLAWGLSIGSPRPISNPLATAGNMTWYYTMPGPERAFDPGLLVRAQQQSKAWHVGKPQWFPWNVSEQEDSDMSVANQQSTEEGTRIRTGWSVVLNPPRETLKLVDRMRHIKQHVHDAASSDRSSWPMQCDFGLSSITDENEIELNDEEEQSDMADTDVPSRDEGVTATSLLVLGTGCAAPSPYRGSSGYALFLRDDLTFVFEVGDGFLTQWSRFSSRSLLSIRVIWISHAHWDHYGGLAALLSKHAEMRRQRRMEVGSSDVTSSRKRPRLESHGHLDVPLVLAPGKVLKNLDCFFGDTSNYFHGVDIGRQARHASELVCRLTVNASGPATFPIAFFDIVRVDHSCADSFGFVLGLNQRQQQTPFVFCFSGDTRPCPRFANTCKSCGEQWSLGVVDVLLHEATFDQAEAEMSSRKKHSTVKEAIDIGLSIRARKIYLTHFSQRYNSPPDHDGISNSKWTPMFDGVLVPLFRE